MTQPSLYQPVVERACSTEPGSEEVRKAACDDVVNAINERKLSLHDLAVLLAVPLTSPEKEARENGTRLLGEVVSRCRAVLGDGELHTLTEFLAARLKDWPCVGAAATACRALLQPLPYGGAATSGPDGGPAGAGGRLQDESALMVLQATVEMLRSAQSFRQEERSALLRLLLAAARGWGALAGSRGVELLDGFLGAVDGEKDPRCLMLAFEAIQALCQMYHEPRIDPAPLRQLADEVADWASSYFPISFNPPPSLARGPQAITRADLAAALEAALAASPFLAPGVLPLLVEKLSSTYRPAKEDALSALRRCCPAYGPDALVPHTGQLWPALRSEVLAPCGHGGAATAAAASAAATGPGAGALPAAAPGGEAPACPASLPRAAAGVLTVVVRAAGPGAMDVVALQDASMSDLLSVVRAAAAAGSSATRGSSAQTVARADRQVLCVSMLLAAVCAAGPSSLQRAYDGPLGELRRLLAESLAGADVYDKYEQTLYGMTALTAVVDAVASELAASPSFLGRGGGGGVAALAEVKAALTAALTVVHLRLHAAAGAQQQGDGDATMAPAPLPADGGGGNGDGHVAATTMPLQPGPGGGCYSQPAAAELRLAVVAAWRALLRLHRAAAAGVDADAAVGPAAAAPPSRGLVLTGAELAEAAEQLCACAVRQDAEHPPHACRMRWSQATDVAQEAAGVLKLLLQLQPAAPPPPDGAAAAAGTTDVVALLVRRLVAAMAPAAEGDEAASGRRSVALRLAVQLAQVQEPVVATAAATSGNGTTGSLAFTAALLESLPPLLLGLKAAPRDAEWLKDCLHQLARKVLAPLALPLRPGTQPCAAAAAATAAAAHGMASATLAAAAEWDAAGAASGLPFGGRTTLEPPPPSYSASGPLTEPTLTEAWCTAVQQLVACCDDRQQLDLAMEAAERIAAYGSSLALTSPPGEPLRTSTSTSNTSGGLHPIPLAGLSLSCAAVAGLRPHVLAPHSTQALADSLLCLLASTAGAAAAGTAVTAAAALTRPGVVGGGGGGGGECAGHPSEHYAPCTAAAAVALAAAVNRWQDAAALDAWLASAFRPALLAAIGLPEGGSGAAAASVTAVQAVGWVGRALALRNHPALGEVVEALLTRALGSPPAAQAAADAAAAGAAAMAAAAGGGGAAAAATSAMEVDGLTEGAGSAEDAGARGQVALAASGALGLLVAEEAAAGGVALAARPAQAVCRVLWQQRAYSICAQALEARCRTLPPRAPLPLPLAVAVAGLVEASPRAMCRSDAARLAPLVLRTAQALSIALTGGPPGPAPAAAAAAEVEAAEAAEGAAVHAGPRHSAEADVAAASAAAVAAGALRGVLAVVLDWLQHQKAQPSAQLEKTLQDYATELVDCVCTAAGVGTTPRASRPSGRQQQLLRAPVAAAAAVAVREEALRCCTTILDAVPYHVLHPVRQQVMACILSALDDNKRSVRQLAVRARRVWGDK